MVRMKVLTSIMQTTTKEQKPITDWDWKVAKRIEDWKSYCSLPILHKYSIFMFASVKISALTATLLIREIGFDWFSSY